MVFGGEVCGLAAYKNQQRLKSVPYGVVQIGPERVVGEQMPLGLAPTRRIVGAQPGGFRAAAADLVEYDIVVVVGDRRVAHVAAPGEVAEGRHVVAPPRLDDAPVEHLGKPPYVLVGIGVWGVLPLVGMRHGIRLGGKHFVAEISGGVLRAEAADGRIVEMPYLRGIRERGLHHHKRPAALLGPLARPVLLLLQRRAVRLIVH